MAIEYKFSNDDVIVKCESGIRVDDSKWRFGVSPSWVINELNAQAETISKLEAELAKVNTPIDDTNGTRFYYRDGQVWDGIKSLFHIESDYEASWAVSALNSQASLTQEYMETVHKLEAKLSETERLYNEALRTVQDSQAYEATLLDGNDETSAPDYAGVEADTTTVNITNADTGEILNSFNVPPITWESVHEINLAADEDTVDMVLDEPLTPKDIEQIKEQAKLYGFDVEAETE